MTFRLDGATIGVLHHDGLVEVPVPPSIRTVLVEEGMARPHAALRRIPIEIREYGLPDALAAFYETMLAKRDPGSSAQPGAPPAGA